MLKKTFLLICLTSVFLAALNEKAGWPVMTAPSSGAFFASPLVVDFDGGGDLEVLIAGPDNYVRAYSMDGSPLPGFPFALSGDVSTHIAFGNVTSDDDEMVIVTNSGDLYVINSVSEAVSPFNPLSIGASPGPAGPVLWDFDGDGYKEIVVHAGNNIHVYDRTGLEIGTFPRAVESEFGPAASPAVGDINGDGNVEIVAVGYQKLYAFESNGNILFGFPIELTSSEAFSYSSPILVDMTGNGRLEICCGYHEISGTSRGKIGLWNSGAEMVSSWPISTAGYGSWIYGSPAAGDIDGDGKPEIVILSRNGRGYVLNEDASAPDPWSLGLGMGPVESSPAVYDLDNDIGPDFLFLGNDTLGTVACFNGPAAYVDSFPFYSDTAWGFAAPTVGDFDNDGHFEICAVDRAGKIHMFRGVGDCKPYARPWRMGRHDPLRTGWLYPLNPDSVLVEPSGGLLHISWSKITAYDTLSYKLYSSEDANGSISVINLLNTTDTFAVIEPDSSRCYYFVTACTRYYESQRSKVVTIDTTGILEIANPSSYFIDCYPNPFNATCKITAPPNSFVTIYDVQGRLIESFEKNTGEIVWEPQSHYPSGVYLVSVDYNGIRQAKRLVLLR
jgi:hypothetical protein